MKKLLVLVAVFAVLSILTGAFVAAVGCESLAQICEMGGDCSFWWSNGGPTGASCWCCAAGTCYPHWPGSQLVWQGQCNPNY